MQPEPKVNVLLVDDHPENLLAQGYPEQPRSESGEGPQVQALRRLLNQDFAVILDVQMPGMDGFETATLIRNREQIATHPDYFPDSV